MPETIGALILTAIGASEAASIAIIGSLTIAQAVGTAAILAGTIGLQLLLNRPPAGAQPLGSSALPPPDNGNQPLRQTIPSRMVGLGRVRLGGAYVCYEVNTAGASVDVIVFHHGTVQSIVGFYLQDDVVTLSGGTTGNVNVLGDGRYNGNVISIDVRIGAATETAYSGVISAIPAIWTTSHRGDGLASLSMICDTVTIDQYTVIYPHGLPVPSVVCDATPIFDWRDATQSRGNPLTWKSSTNPVVQTVFFLTDADRGFGFDWNTLIAPALDNLTTKANLCDQGVPLADATTEPRYQSNGSYSLDADPADVLASILDTCDGWISQNGDGSLALEIGYFQQPEITFTSTHIRGFSLQLGVADEEAVNELTTTYTEPNADYKTEPGQPWRDEDDIDERGRTLSQQFALPWVYSHPQTRRLGKRRMAQLNAPIRGTITTTLYGIVALGKRWIKIEADENVPVELANLTIENRGCTIDVMNATLTFKFNSVNPNTIDAWDPATEEGAPPTIPPKLVATLPPDPQDVSIAVDSTNASPGIFGGILQFIGVEITASFDDPGRADLRYQARYAPHGTTFYVFSGVTFGSIVGGQVTITINGGSDPVVLGNAYDFQVKSIDPTGNSSDWSPPTPITVVLS